jgi:undecaprenyl-diphosphatase
MTTHALIARLDARDRQLFLRWCLLTHRDRARRFWSIITHLGGATASIAAVLFPLRADSPIGEAARYAAATLVISHLVVQLVKRTVGRPRPSRHVVGRALITEPDRFSFPSGHAAAAMSIALGYSMVFPSLAPALILVAVAIGASRVFLGVHYPGDVLIGQLIAVLTGLPILLG